MTAPGADRRGMARMNEDFVSPDQAGGIIANGRTCMKNYRTLVPVILAFLAVECLMIPTALKAVKNPDSADITNLLADTKAVAVQLKTDSGQMDSFTRSKLSWQSYASKIETIKGHINNAGQLLGKLKSAESSGSPWQQTTTQRIEPLFSRRRVAVIAAMAIIVLEWADAFSSDSRNGPI